MDKFFIIGINYKKSDAATRGQYAVSNEQHITILQQCATAAVQECFVLSTCNRTEVYAVANQADDVIHLLCTQLNKEVGDFKNVAYIKSGAEAIQHLFAVAAGLDSQILGDYEIVGQLKQSVQLAKKHNVVGTFLERLTNGALQASKSIKANTALSDGTVSVAFAAVRFIQEHCTGIANKKIVLIGTGKIGTSTCKNLIDYLGAKNITLINRTEEKSRQLAKTIGVFYADFRDTAKEVAAADVVVVATNASTPIILKSDVTDTSTKILIDLSIPNNIDPTVTTLPHITLADVDILSKIKDNTLQVRTNAVPQALAIINTHINEFKEWHDMRKNVPVIKALKQKLLVLQEVRQTYATSTTMDCKKNQPITIQKVLNNMASKIRTHERPLGCYYIEAINEFIAP